MSALCPVSLPCQARSHPGPAQAQCTRCSRQRHLHLAVLGPAQPVVRPGSGGLSQSPSRALLAAGARTGSAGRVHRPGERLGRGAARGPKGGGGERPSLGQGRGGRGCAAAPGSPRPGNPDRVPGEARAPPPSGSAGRGRAGQVRAGGPGAAPARRARPRGGEMAARPSRPVPSRLRAHLHAGHTRLQAQLLHHLLHGRHVGGARHGGVGGGLGSALAALPAQLPGAAATPGPRRLRSAAGRGRSVCPGRARPRARENPARPRRGQAAFTSRCPISAITAAGIRVQSILRCSE